MIPINRLLSFANSFTFRKMWKLFESGISSIVFVASILLPAVVGNSQSPNIPPTGRSVFFDSNGRQVSNNEFVDVRMSNFHMPDQTRITTLDDGTVEFRLQKVPQEGMQIPDISVTTIDGKTINSSELKGKVVVLNFWFIGCPVCLNHKPYLNELRAKFAGNDDVIFLAMTDDATSAVKKFVEREKFDYLHAANAGTEMKKFGFTGFPKNIVISRTGEVIYWRSTVRAWDKFESVVRAAVAADQNKKIEE